MSSDCGAVGGCCRCYRGWTEKNRTSSLWLPCWEFRHVARWEQFLSDVTLSYRFFLRRRCVGCVMLVLFLFRWPPGKSSSALNVLQLMDCPWIRHTWWKGVTELLYSVKILVFCWNTLIYIPLGRSRPLSQFFFPSQIWVHQQVCISVWHNAPEGGRTPCRPSALQRRFPGEAEELPQHWQPLTSLYQMLRRDHFSFNNTSRMVISLFSRFSVNLAFRLVNRTLT